jgi:serine/threonine protein kinase
MATNTYARSIYGTQLSTSDAPETTEHSDHYDLFLLIQDMVRSAEDNILEFPIDEWGAEAISIGLGAGGFSSVSRKIAKGRWGNRNVMAYKRTKPPFDVDGRVDEKTALGHTIDELRVLSSARIRSHTNINHLRGILFEPAKYRKDGRLFPVLILDPSPFGNLLDFISDPVRVVDGPYWECCVDVGRGLQALHENRIIHGDVKCENVLVFPAIDYEGRSFVAKLTDFGCSMSMDKVEPYTRLRGSTPPYDAPEADGIIHRECLPCTDIYSYGILIWRVALDGADPFNHPRYRDSKNGDEGKHYNHTLIREDKRDENLLNLVLTEMQDPVLQLSPETADSFCEVLSIALNSDPTQRNLGRIMETFKRNNEFVTLYILFFPGHLSYLLTRLIEVSTKKRLGLPRPLLLS